MLTYCVVWLLSALTAASIYVTLVRSLPNRFIARNFQSNRIPCSAGLIFVGMCALGYGVLLVIGSRAIGSRCLPLVVAVSTFGALGLIDDLFGDRSVGGLKGHFSELLLNHKLTTGAAKAIGGTFSALVAGFLLNPHTPAKALVAAGIIALTANALNLTDTRPGRTILLSLLLIVLSAAIGFSRVTSIDVALFGAPVLLLCVMFLFDRSAKLMMGDVGANSIGALIGAIWVMIVPEQAQLVYFGLLIWFHIWTETHSLSQTIEKTPWLRSIDRLVGVRVGTRID